MKSRKVIFLDIDGVLNGYNFQYHILTKILYKIPLIRRHYDVFNVKLHKAILLAIIVRATGADIVMSSSWRGGYYRFLETGVLTPRMKSLVFKFDLLKLSISGMTPRSLNGKRGKEIQEYLNKHPEITNFVILDDEIFDMGRFKDSDHLVITSRDGKVTGNWRDKTGLRIKHVKQAIKILNRT